MAFVPRPRFPFPATAPSWYIGHMHRAVRRIQETLNAIDLVLEVRDARLPLTSINPAFENLFGSDRGLAKKSGKKRLIVYNRRDLAEPALERVRFRYNTVAIYENRCIDSMRYLSLPLLRDSANTKSTTATRWTAFGVY